MTIKSITVKNAQRHKKKTIALSPGFNVIRGGNNRGKSTIIRLIKWFVTNRPLGNWMIKQGEDVCTLKLVSDEHVGKRMKGVGTNQYVIDDEIYRDVRTDVPKAVEAFGILPIDINGTILWPNIAFTLDDEALFLVPASSSLKYGVLSYLTNCDEIEKVIKTFVSDSREATAQTKVAEIRLDESKQALLTLPDLDLVQKKRKTIEIMLNEHRQLTEEIEFLVQRLENIEEAKEDKVRLEKNLVVFAELPTVDVMEQLEVLDKEISKIEEFYTEYLTYLGDLCKQEVLTNGYKVLCNVLTEISAMLDKQVQMDNVLFSLSAIVGFEHEKNVLVEDIKIVEEKVKRFKVCPYCGKVL